MIEGGKLNFLGDLLIPRLENHDVIAEAIVEKAIKKNRMSVKRPISLQIPLIGRALMPISWGTKLLQISGVGQGMKHWVGRPGSDHAGS